MIDENGPDRVRTLALASPVEPARMHTARLSSTLAAKDYHRGQSETKTSVSIDTNATVSREGF